MHEWALAEAVVFAASKVAEKEGLKRVTEVKVKVGELQQLELEVLKFALDQLKPPQFKDAVFAIETVRAELKCRICGHAWILEHDKMSQENAEAIHFVPEVVHVYIKCPKCGSPDFEVLKGRGVWLEGVGGER